MRVWRASAAVLGAFRRGEEGAWELSVGVMAA